MAKFNRPTSQTTKTENLAGGDAFIESPELELVSLLLTSFVESKYYESTDEQLDRLVTLLDKVDKRFAAKAAIYARNEFGMRSITHVVIGELVRLVKGQPWMKNAIAKTVRRPDDMTEMVAYYLGKYGKPVPNSLKKGIALAFGKFDEYQLAKYRGAKAGIKLVDLVNLTHPTPKKGQEDVFKKLVNDELRSKDTWEAKMTKAGQEAKTDEEKEELKKEVWANLIKERKIGYFALLRNLRNILEQSPEVIDEALALLTDDHLIKRSLVLPFQFSKALEAIESESFARSRDVVVALGKALDLSLSNVPKFDGKTLVVVDDSGSMLGQPIKIASLFAAILYKTNDADLMRFSSDASYMTLNPEDSTLTLAKTIEDNAEGGGTNFHSIFDTANRVYDRIIILSDMQGWMDYDAPTKTFAGYKTRVGANPRIFSFDLQGYGSLQFPEKNVYCISGWSEKIFSVMELLEKDRQALIEEIKKIEL